MGLFRKKNDPISDRARALHAEIAALESQIKQLNTRIENGHSVQPRFRSTRTSVASAVGLPASASPRVPEPIFERVDHENVAAAPERVLSAGLSRADLGLRKPDSVGIWLRIQNHFSRSPATNPKLVSYLAAGSIKGLRPLRYEKRVARNRFLGLTILLLLLLWGVYAAFVRL